MTSYTHYTSDICVSSCGREWFLQRPSALENLWEGITDDEFGDDERLPYWVELWPASIALCEWLQKNRRFLQGAACIDLGCGLGLSTIVGSWLGASVIGMDYEAEALVYARKNADRNGVPQPLWAVMDWRFPAVAPHSIDVIWGGDIMYERRFVSPVLAFMSYALAPGGRIWMAEPGRDVYQHFRAALLAGGWLARCVQQSKVDPLYIQPVSVTVNMWELTRG